MARFDGTVREAWVCEGSTDTVRAHFLSVTAFARATVGVERAEELGDGRLRLVLAPQKHGAYTFQPDYTVHVRREVDDVVWSAVAGNLGNAGRARFTPEGSRTRVVIDQTVTVEVPVPALAVALVRPIIDRLLAPGVRDWQQRMVRSVAGG